MCSGRCMLYVCLGDVIDVVFPVSVVKYGAISSRVWKV